MRLGRVARPHALLRDARIGAWLRCPRRRYNPGIGSSSALPAAARPPLATSGGLATRPSPNTAGGAGSGDGPAPLSRLRRPLIALCAALVVAAAVALGVVASSPGRSAGGPAGATQAGPSAGSGPGAPTTAAAQRILDRHGAAVLARDRTAFLADLDSARAAAGYRAAQAATFDNVAGVPLAAWSYQLTAPVTGGSVLADAARRYGAPVLISRVAFRYQLRDADRAPTAHDVWLTFVRRSGRVLIASDADLAGEGGVSWHGPWDFGPVVARRGVASLVLAHPADDAQLPALAEVADRAVAAVTGVWGSGWSRRVVVIIAGSQDEMRAIVGASEGSDTAAATVADDADPGTGLRVVLNPVQVARLSATGLRLVMRHEVTHVATWALTRPSQTMPTWLIEGLADYVANLGSGQPVTVVAGELRAEVAAGKVAAALPANDEFTPGGSRLPQVYEEAWLACRLIAARAGQDALVRLYRKLATSAASPQDALDAALRATLGQSTAQFTARWRHYVRAELGRR